ncbi:hypothetical protein [uncultured Rikenella sp.]|nr:hypothetical protein [uncultured Rikenella sp.]
MCSIGNYGFNWSAATDDSNGVYLDFSAERLHPYYTHGRANGLQLRCLSE